MGGKIRALRAHLDRTLFLEAPPPAESSIGRGELAILIVALLALGIILQLLRLGWSDSLDTLWAEDGPIFLQGALTHSFVHNVVASYAGYLVVVPRLIGEAATLVPLRDAAATIAILSATVVTLSGVAVWCATAGHIRSPYLRGTLAVLTVLAPVAGQEAVDSAAYVLWYMLFATFWLLLWRPRALRGAALASLFIFTTALSTPGVWFFLPVAALRALAVRDRRDLMIVIAYGLGAGIQAPVVALQTEQAVEPAWTHDIWTAFLQRVVDGAALGLRLGGDAWSHLGWPLLIVLLLATVAGIAIGLRRSDATARWIAAICIPTSLALFAISVYQRALGSQIVWPADNYNWAASRYAIVPALLLVSAALVFIDHLARGQAPKRLVWPTITAMAVLAASIATSFYMRDSVRETPKWRSMVAEAASVCSRRRDPEVTIPITPPSWSLTLPCDQLPPAAHTAGR